MDGIWRELQNPVWWFSVVVAGLMLEVVGHFLAKRLDVSWESLLKRSEANKKLRTAKAEKIIQKLMRNPELRQLLLNQEIRSRFFAVQLSVLAALLSLSAAQANQAGTSSWVSTALTTAAAASVSGLWVALSAASRIGKDVETSLIRLIKERESQERVASMANALVDSPLPGGTLSAAPDPGDK